jgi:hypothetical protein
MMEKIMNITDAGRKRVLASSLLPPLKKAISFLGKRYFVLKYKYFVCCIKVFAAGQVLSPWENRTSSQPW